MATRRFVVVWVGLLALAGSCKDAASDGSASPDAAAGTDDGAPDAATMPGSGSDAARDVATTDAPGGGLKTVATFSASPVRKLDLLFMVDNSASMAQEQENLKLNFPRFMDRLAALPGGLPELHIGVVSSDVGAGAIQIPANPACNRPGGDRGRMDPANKAATCGLIGGFHYLVQIGAQKNFSGDLSSTFGCMAQLGTQGCDFEHQLQSTRVALIDNLNPENQGFLHRDNAGDPDAFLAIVYITDEDDCSGTTDSELYAAGTDMYPNQTSNARCAIRGHVRNGMPLPNGQELAAPLAEMSAGPGGPGKQDLIPVREFVDFLIGPTGLYAKAPERVLVSAIIGWPAQVAGATYRLQKFSQPPTDVQLIDLAPICQSTNGQAAPGLRIKSFVDAFGANGSVHSICDGDFRPALENIATRIAAKLTPGCLAAPLADRDAATPGIQPECEVFDREPLGSGRFDDTRLPRCDAAAGALPCWRLQSPAEQNTDAKCGANQFRVVVDRNAPPPASVIQLVRCATTD